VPAAPLPWLTWNLRSARAQVGMTAGRAECAGVVGAAEAAVAVSAVVQPSATATAARRTVLTENSMNIPLDDGGPVGRPPVKTQVRGAGLIGPGGPDGHGSSGRGASRQGQ
jgi:hypothetical protein